MGLDINFYKESKLDDRYHEEIGYFRKVNFILNYFNISEDMNCRKVYITKEQLEQFIGDLDSELYRKCKYGYNEPANEKLRTKHVFFGGSLDYDECYWNDIRYARDWANEAINDVDWDKDNVYIIAWW